MSVVQERNLYPDGLWLDVPDVRTKQEYPCLPPAPQASRGDAEPAGEYTAHIEVHITAEATLNPIVKPLVNIPCPTSAPGDSI